MQSCFSRRFEHCEIFFHFSPLTGENQAIMAQPQSLLEDQKETPDFVSRSSAWRQLIQDAPYQQNCSYNP
jgi:hypothetical protein